MASGVYTINIVTQPVAAGGVGFTLLTLDPTSVVEVGDPSGITVDPDLVHLNVPVGIGVVGLFGQILYVHTPPYVVNKLGVLVVFATAMSAGAFNDAGTGVATASVSSSAAMGGGQASIGGRNLSAHDPVSADSGVLAVNWNSTQWVVGHIGWPEPEPEPE